MLFLPFTYLFTMFSLSACQNILNIIEAAIDHFSEQVSNQTNEISAEITTFVIRDYGRALRLPLGTAMTTPEIIQANGYPVEIHHTTTEDGYILELHRIPHGRDETHYTQRPVVFLMPGILSTSSAYMTNVGSKSLAFILAEEHYDVWIGNARGTQYSNRHANPQISREQFYNFSLTEIGVYDLPASIDYALNNTGSERLFYIGHSQGTTDFFVMLSERPDYAKKINLMSALAPVSYLNNTSAWIQVAADNWPILLVLLKQLGLYDTLYTTPPLQLANILLSNDLSPLQFIYSSVYVLVSGFCPEEFNRTILPLLFTQFPMGTSMYVFAQYAQIIVTGNFQKYDYGHERNMVAYGQKNPPQYNISNIISAVAMYYSLGDAITSPIDVMRLARQLPNLAKMYQVPQSNFGHFDFIAGKNVKSFVYDELIAFMKTFQ